jgi:hypothetical protein
MVAESSDTPGMTILNSAFGFFTANGELLRELASREEVA